MAVDIEKLAIELRQTMDAAKAHIERVEPMIAKFEQHMARVEPLIARMEALQRPDVVKDDNEDEKDTNQGESSPSNEWAKKA